ncbi:MAG: hypothetical protein Q4F38_08130 [Akkermansia sp.]|nr:hypothetical protein [Akkermansia sp.]
MKNAFLSMFAVAVCGAMTASAVDATVAQVTLITKGAPAKIERLGAPTAMNFPGSAMSAQPVVGWQVVNVPIKVEAKTSGDDVPQFVPQLSVTAHLLIESDNNDGKPVLLSKKIDYVDVPVAGSSEPAKCEMCVGVFIPPSSAVKINKKGKGDLKGKLLGLAVEATFKDKNCINTKEDNFIVYDNKTKSKLSSKWWTRKMGSAGAVACSVNETPYAPFIGNFYPATSPRFGAGQAAPASPSTPYTPSVTPAEGDTTTPTGGTDTPATTEGGDTTGADSTATGAEESCRSRDRRRRGDRSSRRSRN